MSARSNVGAMQGSMKVVHSGARGGLQGCTRGEQHCRVLPGAPRRHAHIVQRRIRHQVLEVCHLIWVAIIGHPGMP